MLEMGQGQALEYGKSHRGKKRGADALDTEPDCCTRVGDFESPLDAKFNFAGDQEKRR